MRFTVFVIMIIVLLYLLGTKIDYYLYERQAPVQTTKLEILNKTSLSVKESPIEFYTVCLNNQKFLLVKESDSLGITQLLNGIGRPIHCEFKNEVER